MTRILGRAANVARKSDDAHVPPQLIGGRFFVYRYDAVGRTESEPPTLPLSPVPRSIHDGSWYLVAELLFRLPHDGVPMNWRILVDVETDAILCLRALSSCLVRGKVFPHDPGLLSTRLLEGIEFNGVLKANPAHPSYEASLLALDAALAANAAEVTKYDLPHWQALIQSRRASACVRPILEN